MISKRIPSKLMFCFLWTFSFLSIALSAFHSNANQPSVTIYHNDQTLTKIQQLVFEFDHPVTYVGGIPTAEQLEYVDVIKGDPQATKAAKSRGKGDNKWLPKCHWRYVDTKRLACELDKPLLPGSIYHLAVHKGFVGLNDWQLDKTVTQTIRTPFPKQIFTSAYDESDLYYVWPIMGLSASIQANDNRWLQAFLTKTMQIRKPNGDVIDVEVSFNEERRYSPLDVDIKAADFVQDGRYELFIPQGTQFEFADYVNDEAILLYHHEFYQDFKLLGARCYDEKQLNSLQRLPEHDDNKPMVENRPKWRLDNLDNCQPEYFELAFSRQMNAREQLKPLLNDEKFAIVRSDENENGRFVYRFELGENKRYRWGLASLVSNNGQRYAGKQNIELTTSKPIPRWRFKRSKSHTPLDREIPLIDAINVDALAGEMTVIDNLATLQAWIKGDKLPTKPYIWPLKYSDDYIWQKGAEQTFDFNDFLPTGSGILHLDLSIQGLEDRQAQRQAKSHRVNAFNVQMLQADDWLIQTTDWQHGEPMAGVYINLVCNDESLSTYLGQTDELGILNVPVDMQKDKCWLWGEHNLGSAAIRLGSRHGDGSGNGNGNDAAITAWSGQPVYEPGKTVDFGVMGKIRTQNGLKAINSWDGKQLYFGHSMSASNDDVQVEIPIFSTFGMASVSIKTQEHWPVGRYYLKLYHSDYLNDVDVIGEVDIEYYETPEYKVTFKGTERMSVGDSFDWSLEAKRLNGVALAGAKVQVEYNVNNIGAPPFWPQGFKWLTTDLFNSAKIKSPVFNGKLDKNGLVNGQTSQINHQSGVLNVSASATVTAKDGEVQIHHAHGYYFGADYYFGVKVNTEQQSIELVVIDKDGNLSDGALPKALRELFEQDGLEVKIEQSSRGKVIRTVTCQFNSLQDNCLLKGLEYQLVVTVSAHGKVLAKGDIYVSKHHVRQSHEPFAFDDRNLNVSANDATVDLTLNANLTGKALIVVSTDKIESYFYQDINKGSNQFTLPLKRQYMPQITVEAIMTVADHQRSDVQKKHGERSVASKIIIGLQQPQNLQVAVQTPAGEQLSGAAIDVSFNANQLVDSQSWLVNEGLWQLLGIDEQIYDLPYFLSLLEANNYSSFWAGAKRFIESYSNDGVIGYFNSGPNMGGSVEKIGVTGSLMALGDSGQDSPQSAQFVDSIWFAPMALKVDEPQSLQFNLPKVPGRYKLVTIAANDDQFDLDVQTIVTYLPQEYFIDAPNHMVQSDQAKLLITAINRTDTPLNETLKLTLDGQPWRDLEVTGQANSQQVISVDIKRLSAGEHVLGVWHDDFGQVGERHLKVKPDTISVSRQFVIGGKEGGKGAGKERGEEGKNIRLPSDYLAGSLKFTGRDISGLAPSWDSHLQSVRHYPYQCWEQNISRAVSYAHSPVAAKDWPQGQQVFERLLNGANQFTRSDGFSYFAEFGADGFLTAYSHLVGSWLEDSPFKKQASKLRLSDEVSDILTQGDNTERSMALLALAKAGELNKAQVLEHRGNIGASNGFAQVLQVLALRHVNADDKLIDSAIKDILRRGYQDVGVSILSDNAERCFAYMAFGQNHPRAEKLLEQVLAEQWQTGDFGTTFALAACSVAFKDKPTQSAPLKLLKHKVKGLLAKVDLVGGNRSQVVMTYQQAIDKQPAYSRGIKLKQQYYIATDTDNWNELKKPQDKWRLMPDNHTLAIGDLVRVVMTVDSPIRREHVVLNSPIAGTFEVDNAKFEHSASGQFGGSGMSHMSMNMSVGRSIGGGRGIVRPPDRPIMPMVEQQIALDKVLLFPYWLQAGKTEFSYLMKVRHAGEFIAPGAKVEMMYQPDVTAQTKGRYFRVMGY